LHLGRATFGLRQEPVLAGAIELKPCDVDVARGCRISSRYADALELRARLENRRLVEVFRNPDARGRKRDDLSLGIDDKERDSDLSGLVILRAVDGRDVVTGSTPELFERHTASRHSDRRRLTARPAARGDEQARQHGQCRSQAHTRPSLAVRSLVAVGPGVARTGLPEPRREQRKIEQQ
jgi:hypothetical protein